MEYKVGVISGDGIGPEIVTEAKKVLDQIGKTYGHVFRYEEILIPRRSRCVAAGEETGGGTFKAPQGAEPVC